MLTEKQKRELARCRVPLSPSGNEGRLLDLAVTWGSGYWVVHGDVPLEMAELLYADPVGRTDVRVNGHCGCPPPREECKWVSPDGRQVLDRVNEEECTRLSASEFPALKRIALNIHATHHFADDPSQYPGVLGYVDCYHIDSEVGLRVFADTILRNSGKSG